jgi:NAD(P)-dependent dehydrogenase (short-subunit alcohol dehydrogenase family)
MTGSCEGKVAIVTGTAQGIGRAIAEVLLREGATVAGCDLNPPRGEDLGDRYTHTIVDVTDFAGLDGFVRQVADEHGGLDILVNNAGAHPPHTPVDDVSVAGFEALLAQNLTSVFAACRAALPALRRRAGAIVNLSSGVALYGQNGAAAYCATKGAISAMSRSLAIDEAAHGVRVNCVCPGAIDTAMAGPPSPQATALAGSLAWLNRRGTATEVAEVVTFLASDRASFVTGQDVMIAGGADLGYGLKANTFYDATAAVAAAAAPAATR